MNKMNPLYMNALRFGGHGPPTRIGFPHAWGAMKWCPCRAIIGFAMFIQFQMIGLIIWYKWDTIPYPAHRYNDQNTTARNY